MFHGWVSHQLIKFLAEKSLVVIHPKRRILLKKHTEMQQMLPVIQIRHSVNFLDVLHIVKVDKLQLLQQVEK